MALDKVVDSVALDAGMTAVANAIRAKGGTTEPLVWPDGFKEAVEAISGGGNAVQIGQESPAPNFMNLFYALEQGTAATGTFTLASPISGETLIFSSGLPVLNGIMLVNTDRTEEIGSNEGVWFSLGLLSEGALLFGVVRNTTAGGAGVAGYGIIVRGTWRIDGGDFYVTPRFNANSAYTPFRSSETYRWVAW